MTVIIIIILWYWDQHPGLHLQPFLFGNRISKSHQVAKTGLKPTILLPQSPRILGSQVCTTTPDLEYILKNHNAALGEAAQGDSVFREGY